MNTLTESVMTARVAIQGYTATERELGFAMPPKVGQIITLNPATVIAGEALADRFGWQEGFRATITAVGSHWSVIGVSGYHVDLQLA